MKQGKLDIYLFKALILSLIKLQFLKSASGEKFKNRSLMCLKWKIFKKEVY